MPEAPKTYKMFGTTKGTLTQKLTDLDGRLSQNREEFSSLDSDGDMMDDPILHRLQYERIHLTDEQIAILEHRSGAEVLDPSVLENINQVSIGHEVTAEVVYPDGEDDVLKLTIGTRYDSQYLKNGDLQQLGYDGMLISQESTLAQVILGRHVGESIPYNTPDGQGLVTILGLQVSPLARIE